MPASIDQISFTDDWVWTLGQSLLQVRSKDNIHILATDQNL